MGDGLGKAYLVGGQRGLAARHPARGSSPPRPPAAPDRGRGAPPRPRHSGAGGARTRVARSSGSVPAGRTARTRSAGPSRGWADRRRDRVPGHRAGSAPRPARPRPARGGLASAVSSAISLEIVSRSVARSSASSRSRASRRSAWMPAARRATSACLPSGLSWRRSSVVRSVSRLRLTPIASSLRSAFSLRLRCLRTPAASSMNARRSSGLACRTVSSWPWPTMTCISRPMPESESRSWMSSSRHASPLISYSLSPDRNIRRVIETSVYSIGSAPSELSIVSVTSARPSGGRPPAPAKMTSSILPPRSALAPCSPSTQEIASTTLDLPEPFGPTTQVIPGSSLSVVADAKDLKPFTVRLFRCTGLRRGTHSVAHGHGEATIFIPHPCSEGTRSGKARRIHSRFITRAPGRAVSIARCARRRHSLNKRAPNHKGIGALVFNCRDQSGGITPWGRCSRDLGPGWRRRMVDCQGSFR